MKIGIYCGSFSPVHNGHTTIMNESLTVCDKVIVVPTGDYWDKKVSIPIEKRIKALKLFETDKIFIDENLGDIHSRYTSELMRRLQARYPSYELVFIMGSDGLPTFSKWNDYNYLLKFPFLIMRRDGTDPDKEMKKLNKTNYQVFDVPAIDVSSTYIREHLNDPESLIGKIDPRVIEIIGSV